MHSEKQSRSAALVSRHPPTCRKVAQSLGAAGLHVRAAPTPSALPVISDGDVVALLVDLDVAPEAPAAELLAEATRAYPDVPVLVTAGVDARTRLLDALCEAQVCHVMPKRGAFAAARAGAHPPLEGPDEHDLFAAVRRLFDHESPAPGVTPYLLAGADVHELVIHDSDDKDAALAAVTAFAESLDLDGERLRRVELAAEELLLNALYDAPRGADGKSRHGDADRRASVTLAAGETVRLRFGCDGQTFAIAVADPFGALERSAVTDRLRKVRDGLPRPQPGAGGAGLGLAMTWSVANSLVFSVTPGAVTEVTAVLYVGGSNRAAQERGTAVHFYQGRS